jgi:type IV pilus assembly protein PilY1
MGGQLWRFDKDPNNTNPFPSGWTGKVIFRSNPSGEKRKIFYPPDVSFESGYEWVYIGTGDRENPKQETGTVGFPTWNRLYAIKDTNPSTPLTESNLVNVTSNILQDLLRIPDPSPEQIDARNQILNDLNTKNGWFITLENTGEKCLAPPVLYSGVLYYTTFTPSYENVGDICHLAGGTGRVYVLQYKTGMAAINYDLSNDTEGQPPILSKTDRLMKIGSGIPSQVVIAIVDGEVVAYIGIGGGVFSPEVTLPKNIKPLYWRTVF